ncbi:MAG: GtrA family protein [Clostridiaceae bacterium]|nr:GtrA family protein [Clostridiaceae bacterium]
MIKEALKKFSWLWQFIRFSMVGTISTVSMFVAYYIVIYLGFSPYTANTAGFLISVCCSYFLNRIWVFNEQNLPVRLTSIRFFLVNLFCYLLSYGITYVMIDVLGLSKLLPPVVSVLLTGPVNFILCRNWAFKQKPRTETELHD